MRFPSVTTSYRPSHPNTRENLRIKALSENGAGTVLAATITRVQERTPDLVHSVDYNSHSTPM